MLLRDVRACRLCSEVLPEGPRPIVQARADARILIASQAPGRIAHRSGVPFKDPSGRRLRAWMGIDEATFYDPGAVAIVPMGFCYPGRSGGGDAPPRPECAPLWRRSVLEQLGSIRLTLLIGRHAQAWHLPGRPRPVGDLSRAWLDGQVPDHRDLVPLPHPSPRNNGWLERHAWFERDLIPRLRERVAWALDSSS